MHGRSIVRTALLVASAACARPGDQGARDAPGGLEGFWSVELRLDNPAQLLADTAGMKPVRGRVALLDVAPPARAGGRPLHYGSHSVDTEPFGIVVGVRGRVPAAEAWRPAADSVEVTLEPGAPGGGLHMAGRLWADSAAGRWWWHGAGRGTSAAGRFVLRRE